MKRITIEWVKETSDGMEGIVTLDKFKENDVMSISKTSTCNCSVSNNSVGMSGIGFYGVVVPLTEEELSQVFELMRWYFAGQNKKKETYYWFMEGGIR